MDDEDILLEQRNAHMSAIRSSAQSQQEGLDPSCLWDLNEFMMYFFCSSKRRPLCFTAIPNTEALTLGLSYQDEDNTINGVINFFGYGTWSYNFDVAIPRKTLFNSQVKDFNHIKISFEGKGILVRKKPIEENSSYAFMLEERIDKLLVIKELFKNIPEKMFSINRGIKKHDEFISPGWAISFYDGPLAGFCYLNNKLHYYALSEELEYSRERLALVYPLALWQKFNAHLNHFIFNQYLKGRKKTHKFLKIFIRKNIKYDKLEPVGGIRY